MNMLCGKLISFNGGVIEWSSKYMEKRKEKMVLGYQIPTKINDHIIGISEEAMSEQMRLAPIFPMVYTDDGYFHPTKADEIYMSLKLKGYDIYMTSTLLNNFNEWVYRYLKIEKTKKKADIISPIPGGFTFDDTTYSVMKYINGTEIHFSGIGKKSFEHTCQILLFDHVDITISVEWDFDMSDKTS
jgi:methionine aminopeptidase